VGLAVLPIALGVAVRAGPARSWRTAATAGACAAAVLAPWLAGNLAQTGNPVFPFAAELLGRGHWDAAQAAAWTRAHLAGPGPGARLLEGWNQLLRFGLGPSPYPGSEPWLPQWSLLPWLALAGLALAALRQATRPAAVMLGAQLLLQGAFWLAATHVRSRFMVPALPLMCVLAAIGLIPPMRGSLAPFLGLPCLGWSLQPLLSFAHERQSAPAALVGLARARTGEALSAQEREEMARLWPEVYVNFLLRPEARVLLLGEATPFYYDASRVAYQTTWDRGPLERLLRAHPGAPAAWIEGLRAAGFSHLLVNRVMLDRWRASGWSDPHLSALSVAALCAMAEERRLFPPGPDWAVGVFATERSP
jgi:hypothetical protein